MKKKSLQNERSLIEVSNEDDGQDVGQDVGQDHVEK